MDVKVSDGDIAMVASGDYRYITGIEEAVQRVRISALTFKGDFIYDRELGTDYSGLSADDDMLCEKLELLLKESCVDIHDTTVEVASCDSESLIAVLKITFRNRETTTEVNLSGIIQ
ncbi:MAG: hypothetical protein IJH40_06880 [Ruminococcus sp.]|uniref:hypothetical protein n=1 Tax=Ruminococcus sp. TaxID=41978 RepID=UPI0028734ECE|nr:hypothetical protein [Ruminococcus sp.]MBQ3285350.1 hypothetical protein [Ruminococcus sp.]